MSQMSAAIQGFWSDNGDEVNLDLSILLMATINLALFYLFTENQSAFRASLITNGIMTLALAIFFYRLDVAGVEEDAWRAIIVGSLLTFFPHAVVFALPQITALESLWGSTAYLLAALGALWLGLKIVHNCWAPSSSRIYTFILAVFVVSCGALGKIAYGDWSWLWGTALLASSVTLEEQGYRDVRPGNWSLFATVLSCFAWLVARHKLWHIDPSLGIIIDLVCLVGLFIGGFFAGKVIRGLAESRSSTSA